MNLTNLRGIVVLKLYCMQIFCGNKKKYCYNYTSNNNSQCQSANKPHPQCENIWHEVFTDLAVLQYPATACLWKLKATAKYLKHGCFRVSNMSILTLLSCQPLRNSRRFDSFTYTQKLQKLMHSITGLQHLSELNVAVLEALTQFKPPAKTVAFCSWLPIRIAIVNKKAFKKIHGYGSRYCSK